MIETISKILHVLTPLASGVIVFSYAWRTWRLDRFRAAALQAVITGGLQAAGYPGGKLWFTETAAIAEHLAQAMIEQAGKRRTAMSAAYGRDNAPRMRVPVSGDYVEIAYGAPDA